MPLSILCETAYARSKPGRRPSYQFVLRRPEAPFRSDNDVMPISMRMSQPIVDATLNELLESQVSLRKSLMSAIDAF